MSYGAWLKDANPRNELYADKIWVTFENDFDHVYEYASKGAYRNNSGRVIDLKDHPFRVSSSSIMYM